MQSGIDVLDKTVQLTNQWLDDIAALLDAPDRQLAYQAMRCVLIAIRDRIGTDNAAHLAAQLPLLIRGVFYDGFHPAATPSKERSREAFLENVDHGVFRGLGVSPEQATRAVLKVLAQRIDPGQVEKVARLFPMELRDLWPDYGELPESRTSGRTSRNSNEGRHADRG